MALIDVGDAEIFTEELGDGEPVLLVAGLGGRAQFWAKQASPFSEHFRVILHDHRGTGRSTPGKAVSGVAQMANDVIALMNALEIENAHLVGHSTGGAIGQHIALHHPERLNRLVLSCSWPGPDAFFTKLFQTRRDILEKCGAETYLASGTFLATPSSALQRELSAPGSFFGDRLASFPGIDVELSRLDAVAAHDLRADLHKITHDTLCIGARDDQITPPGFTEELAALIPDATLRLLDHGGHFCAMTNADAYNTIVLKFLRNQMEN